MVTREREAGIPASSTIAGAVAVETDAAVIEQDGDWKEPPQGITALSGVKVTRGQPSPDGAFTWTVTWPWYQHFVPTMDAITYGSNFSSATINVTRIPNRHLHGYHLVLGVMEMSDGLDYWRSTTYCNVEIIEGDEPPEEFTEMWSMEYASGAIGTGESMIWLQLVAVLVSVSLAL